MALCDRLMNELRATTAGSSEAMLGPMIWNMLNEACREGLIWRETIPITLTAGIAAYTVAPAGAEVVQAFSVSHATIDFNNNKAIYEYNILTLTTAPTVAEAAAGPIYVVAALTPSLDAPYSLPAEIEALIPEDMWSKHHQMFYHGVMARLLAQPAKPYTNPQLAAFYGRAFLGKLAETKHEIATAGVPGAQRWYFPNWAPRPRR